MKLPDSNNMTAESVAQDVDDLFRRGGASQYGREVVTQLEHALQAALLAEQEQASPALIAAALLHDVGHLLHDLPDDSPDSGVDDLHERRGYAWLKRRFGSDVTEPVLMHVEAKRYLCAVDADYRAALSGPSETSLRLQGGPMSPQETERFEQHARFSDCIRVRRWDDQAKVVGLPTPSLEHFLKRVISAASVASRRKLGECPPN